MLPSVGPAKFTENPIIQNIKRAPKEKAAAMI